MLNVVWFTRDLRIHDHRPLHEASRLGETLPIFVVEPTMWQGSHFSKRHLQFVLESLTHLQQALSALGGTLFVATAEPTEVLQALNDTYGDFTLYAHKDRALPDSDIHAVRAWMEGRGFPFQEYSELPGPLSSSKAFKKQWRHWMEQELVPAPSSIRLPEQSPPSLFTSSLKKLVSDDVHGRVIQFGQQGGETVAKETLASFLLDRFPTYLTHQTSPIGSSTSGSRLSPYLAWGNLSSRAVVQATWEQLSRDNGDESQTPLQAFLARLQARDELLWKASFELEASANSGINQGDILGGHQEDLFERWYEGQTGIPFVDATMRCLHKTGWANDRLRAMVVSFACGLLKSDTQNVADRLAQLFLDYEPAIHIFQVNKIRSARLIHPIKLGKELDREGTFIRRYVPELEKVHINYLHEPWRSPAFYQLGYPAPVVDVDQAIRLARIRRTNQTPVVRERNDAVANSTEQLSFTWD